MRRRTRPRSPPECAKGQSQLLVSTLQRVGCAKRGVPAERTSRNVLPSPMSRARQRNSAMSCAATAGCARKAVQPAATAADCHGFNCTLTLRTRPARATKPPARCAAGPAASPPSSSLSAPSSSPPSPPPPTLRPALGEGDGSLLAMLPPGDAGLAPGGEAGRNLSAGARATRPALSSPESSPLSPSSSLDAASSSAPVRLALRRAAYRRTCLLRITRSDCVTRTRGRAGKARYAAVHEKRALCMRNERFRPTPASERRARAFRAEAPTQVAAPIASGASSDTASRPCTSSPRAQSAGSVRTSTSDTRAATAPTQPRMGGQPSGKRCVIAVTCATAGTPVSRRLKWRVVRRGGACLQESEVRARHSG